MSDYTQARATAERNIDGSETLTLPLVYADAPPEAVTEGMTPYELQRYSSDWGKVCRELASLAKLCTELLDVAIHHPEHLPDYNGAMGGGIPGYLAGEYERAATRMYHLKLAVQHRQAWAEKQAEGS